MIKYLKLMITVAVLSLLALTSCEDYVNNIEKPIDNLADDQLNEPEDIPFLVDGIKVSWIITWDEHSLFSDGMSDAMEFTFDISSATFTTYYSLDYPFIQSQNYPLLPQNNSTEALYEELGRFRLHCDTLIERINNRMTFDDQTMAYKNMGLYNAYFYGAIARYMLGSYWCLDPNNDDGGGTINKGPYIPAEDLYADALNRLDEAAKYASNPSQIRRINTLKARIKLYQGKYSECMTLSNEGMTFGDPPMTAEYNAAEANQWYYWAGPGRTQFHAADRFGQYVYDDPEEANRIPIYRIAGRSPRIFPSDTVIGGVQYSAGDTTVKIYTQQNKYTQLGAGMVFMSWQENMLMQAEVMIRQDQNTNGLDLINQVRASHGISPLTADDVENNYGGDYLELLYVERDKELAFTGLRLMDQLRFDKWHFPADATWERMPVSLDERRANDYID